MRITDSQVNLYGRSRHTFAVNRDEQLRMWVGNTRPNFEAADSDSTQATDRVDLSLEARLAALQETVENTERYTSALKDYAARQASSVVFGKTEKTDDDAFWENNPKYRLMKLLIEKFTGRKIMMGVNAVTKSSTDAQSAQAAQQSTQTQRQGWGLEYDYKEETVETEKASFSASGVVKTSDGKELRFDLDLEMSRETVTVEQFSLRAGDAVMKDPLVINFGATAAELTDQKYDFDLNADGTKERISFVTSGSGFLALDKNGDGVVNDGSELFGPRTNNGFAELSKFDGDGNGWIDEADAAYTDLRVWTKNADGTDFLSGLKEKNVGAIYLGSAGTAFGLNDSSGAQQGAVRTTGVYLSEDGQAQTIQQVDLVT